MARLFEHVDQESIKKGEDILYLILLEFSSTSGDEENWRDWKFVTGRQAAYDYIKNILLDEDERISESLLDVDKSLIYADNPYVTDSKLKLSNGINVYKFMKDCYVLQKVVEEDGFDIEDYHNGELDKEEQ